MSTLAITKKQAFKTLSHFPISKIQSIIHDLIKAKLYHPPTADELYVECSSMIKKHKLSLSVLEEAKQWVRSKKSF